MGALDWVTKVWVGGIVHDWMMGEMVKYPKSLNKEPRRINIRECVRNTTHLIHTHWEVNAREQRITIGKAGQVET